MNAIIFLIIRIKLRCSKDKPIEIEHPNKILLVNVYISPYGQKHYLDEKALLRRFYL